MKSVPVMPGIMTSQTMRSGAPVVWRMPSAMSAEAASVTLYSARRPRTSNARTASSSSTMRMCFMLLRSCADDLHELELEDQRRLRRNRARTAGLAISHLPRDGDLALAADLHPA